jgi:hypothetical protein
MASLDAEIDRLYQLPLNEFIAARSALAKTAGAKAGEVRKLAKPSLPAWGVNQLYFAERTTHDRLMTTSEQLRRAHKAVLEGKRADLREADKAHDEAVDAALRKTLALLEKSGHAVTAATRDAVSRTLHALPAAGVEPGRLTKPLTPGGFDMLAGITPTKRAAAVLAFPAQKATAEGKGKDAQAQRKKEREAQKKALAAATRKLRAVREKELRTRKEAERAEADLERARAEAERLRRDAKHAADELADALREAERFK